MFFGMSPRGTRVLCDIRSINHIYIKIYFKKSAFLPIAQLGQVAPDNLVTYLMVTVEVELPRYSLIAMTSI